MKKLFIIIFLLFTQVFYAQVTDIKTVRIATAATTFSENIPEGTQVYNVATDELWVAIASVASGSTLTSASASFKKFESGAHVNEDVLVSGLIEGAGASYANATTNTNAINNALDNLANSKGTVVIPKGIYVINSAITLDANQHIKGQGIGVSTLMMHEDIDDTGTNNQENLITVQPTIATATKHNVTISGLTLDFNIVNIINNGTYGSDWNTRVTTTANDNIGNCIQARGDTTNSEFLDGLTIQNCELKNAGFHGIAIYMWVKNVIIRDNKMLDNYYRAAHIHGDEGDPSESIIVENNFADNNGLDGGGSGNGGIFVFFHNMTRGIISGNIVTNDNGVGIHVSGALEGDTEAEQVIISNNVVEGSKNNYGGYLIGAGTKSMIVSNNISRDNTGTGYEISSLNTTESMVFSSNIAEGNNSRAFYIRDTDYATITGNTFYNNNKTTTGAAVDIENSRYLTFTGNTILDNGADTPNFVYQLRVTASTLGSCDYIKISNNQITTITNSTANPINISGGTAGTPNVRYLTLSDNDIRRGGNETGTVVSTLMQQSTVKHNRVYGGTITDTMTSSDNIIIGEVDAQDAETIDGIDSAGFIRSDVADVKTAGNLRFDDNVNLQFGSDQDAEFFFGGSNTYLDLNVGNLFFRDASGNNIFSFYKSSGYFYQGYDGGLDVQHIMYSDTPGKTLSLTSAGSYSTISSGDTTMNYIFDQLIFYDDTVTEVGRFNTSGNFYLENNLILDETNNYLYGAITGGADSRIHGINGNVEYIGSMDQDVLNTYIGTQTDELTFRTNSTNAIYVNSSQNVDVPNGDLSVAGNNVYYFDGSKKLVWFGDSQVNSTTGDYVADVISELGVTGTVTHADGGDDLTDQIVVLDALISGDANYFDAFDIVLLHIGVNDFNYDNPLGDLDDASTDATFIGELKDFIETVLTSNPEVEIYLITPPETDTVGLPYKSQNANFDTLEYFAEAMVKVAAQKSVFSIDLNAISGMNDVTMSAYSSDDLHINTTFGKAKVGRIVSDAIRRKTSLGNGTPTFDRFRYLGLAQGVNSTATKFEIENLDTTVVSGEDLGEINFISNDANLGSRTTAASIKTEMYDAGFWYGLSFYTLGSSLNKAMTIDNNGFTSILRDSNEARFFINRTGTAASEFATKVSQGVVWDYTNGASGYDWQIESASKMTLTEAGALTVNDSDITATNGNMNAEAFVKEGGDGTNILLDDGTTTPLFLTQTQIQDPEIHARRYTKRIIDQNGVYESLDALSFDIGNITQETIQFTPFGTTVDSIYVMNVREPSNNNTDFLYSRTDTAHRINSYGEVEDVSADVALIDYTTGVGTLLFEPSMTNVALRSEEFDNASWTKSEVTVTADNILAPDGTLTAERIVESNNTNNHHVRQYNSSLTNATEYTFSTFVKAGERHRLRLTTHDGYAEYNLRTKTITNEVAIDEATIEEFANGWFRVSMTNISTNTFSNHYIYILDDSGSLSYKGDTTKGLYLWGAQLEESEYLSSYIGPVAGTSVSRSVGAADGAGDNTVINTTAGVLYADMAALVDDATDRQITLNDATTSDYAMIGFDNVTNRIEARYSTGGLVQATLYHTVTDITAFHKVAFKYALNDFELWVDGVEVANDNSGTVNNAGDFIQLELADGNGGNTFYGRIRELKIFPVILDDTELAALTSKNDYTPKYLARTNIDPYFTKDVTVAGEVKAASVNGVYTKKVSLSSAQILLLNTTPIELVEAPGADKAIVVQDIIYDLDFITAAYTGNTVLEVEYSGQSGSITTMNSVLNSAADITRTSQGIGTYTMFKNNAIDLTVQNGDPSTGSGTMNIYITYKIINF